MTRPTEETAPDGLDHRAGTPAVVYTVTDGVAASP